MELVSRSFMGRFSSFNPHGVLPKWALPKAPPPAPKKEIAYFFILAVKEKIAKLDFFYNGILVTRKGTFFTVGMWKRYNFVV